MHCIFYIGGIIWTRLLTIILLFSSPTYSADVHNRILESIAPNSITIIGERHRRPEAIGFFRSIIINHLQQNKCLTIALEIASNQQSLLDKMTQGKATVTDIEITPIIDHPAFRALITELAEMQRHNDCLKLVAIDAALDLKANRDAWMAIKLATQINETPLLALLGNLHTLKKVDWDLTMTKGLPYVAEILTAQGHNIKTFPQIWPDRGCIAKTRFVAADKPEATSHVNNHLISRLNAFKTKAASDIIDGIILWECGDL